MALSLLSWFWWKMIKWWIRTHNPILYCLSLVNLFILSNYLFLFYLNGYLFYLYCATYVLLLVTDAASYMIRAYEVLSSLYPKMVHLTCLAHGFNRVAEQVRTEFPIANSFISAVKRVFVLAPSCIRVFREMCLNILLSPEPWTARWGTWIE